jgi:antitoxin ParD1/3/4
MIKSYTDLVGKGNRRMARNTQPMSITLPHDMAAMVRAKVESGEYATESEVIRDGLRALQARDAAVENWLRDEVAKSFNSFDKGVARPRMTASKAEALARLLEAYRARMEKQAGEEGADIGTPDSAPRPPLPEQRSGTGRGKAKGVGSEAGRRG